MCLEAEHRTEAADKLRANPGRGAANYFPFFHAPEIEALTLRIVCNTLGDEVAFGDCEDWTAVRNHRRGFANCGKNLLKLPSTTQFREERFLAMDRARRSARRLFGATESSPAIVLPTPRCGPSRM